MITVLCILIGLIFAGATFCLLRRSLMRVLIGILLLGHGVNLLLLATSEPISRNVAILGEDGLPTAAGSADPLPQALILTAIVIGFGLSVFTLVLARSAYMRSGSDDMRELEREEEV
jgi:multicomponent Na+:H+ antiporter subunit C